jgi:hypothetical protein
LQTRPDAEAALKALDGLVLHDMEMRLSPHCLAQAVSPCNVLCCFFLF